VLSHAYFRILSHREDVHCVFHSIFISHFHSHRCNLLFFRHSSTIALGHAYIQTIALGHFNGILITEYDSLRSSLFIGGPRDVSEFGSFQLLISLSSRSCF